MKKSEHIHTAHVTALPLQGYCAAAQTLADYAARGRGSDPDGHEALWLRDCGCDRGPHSGCCHLLSVTRNVVRAVAQVHVCD